MMKDGYEVNLKYVRDVLSSADQYAQLAEEAAELCHAALKMERVLRGTNPTPVTRFQAIDKLFEETADVLTALEVVNLHSNDEMINDAINDIRCEKMDRWVQRLRNKEGEA
jgi:NTP pyrophosphatase (non-canonical NTP hydrolase)